MGLAFNSVRFRPSLNTIHCDMDGVLVDFDKFVLDGLGRTFAHEVGPKGDAEMWEFLAKQERLYYHLEPTVYARELWAVIQSMSVYRQLLTAIPRRTTIAGAEQDKRDWVVKHKKDVFGGEDVKVVIGPFSADKHKHVRYLGDVLVDDREDNIEQWREAGGTGILHRYRDPVSTIRELRKLVI